MHDGDSETFDRSIRRLRLGLVDELQCSSLESTKRVFPALVRLLFINELEIAFKHVHTNDNNNNNSSSSSSSSSSSFSFSQGHFDCLRYGNESNIVNDASRWDAQLEALQHCEFDLIEPLLAQRGVVLQMTAQSDAYYKHVERTAALARKKRHLQEAANALMQLRARHQQGQGGNLRWRWEECKLMWRRNEQRGAINAAKQLVFDLEKTARTDLLLLARVLATTGKWLSQTAAEGSSSIVDSYFRRAQSIFSAQNSSCNSARLAMAHYCDRLYLDTVQTEKSAEWETSMRLKRMKRAELDQLRKLEQSNDVRRHVVYLEQQCKVDDEDTAKFKSGM
jgi:hypothetical protein